MTRPHPIYLVNHDKRIYVKFATDLGNGYQMEPVLAINKFIYLSGHRDAVLLHPMPLAGFKEVEVDFE